MPSDKGTNIFSEIGKFFKENDATSAMNAIMDMTKILRLSEKRLFGSESKCNCKLTQLQVLGLLMLFPCFMIRNAYNYSKITLMIEMIRRIIKRKIHFDYVLADSWFACAEVILFITSRHARCHYLGMIKMGKTKYIYKGEEYTANQFVALFDHPKKGRKYSRRLGCWYITVDVAFAGRNVRLFFCKRSKWGKWNGLITTNRKLDFFEAYRIYSRRWSLEVVFKESKGNLGMGKYQMRNFSSQIAMTAITAMQYNLLSTARRFSDYETVGGLFKDATMSSVELTLTERIWDMILEIVREIAECFNIEDEDIFDTLLNRSDKLSHFVEIYQLKQAS